MLKRLALFSTLTICGFAQAIPGTPSTKGNVTIQVFTVPLRQLAQFMNPSAKVSDAIQVYAHTANKDVKAFRISIQYDYNGNTYAAEQAIPIYGGGMALVSFPVTDTTAKTKSVVVEELKSVSSQEFTIESGY